MKTLAEVRVSINNFNRDFPRPKILPITLSDPVELKLGYLKMLPDSSHAGVYIFLTADNHVMYVGKASAGSTIEARLRSHFSRCGQLKVTQKKIWSQIPKSVAIISMPKGHDFESPAIEEFLILECNPPDNKNVFSLMRAVLSLLDGTQ